MSDIPDAAKSMSPGWQENMPEGRNLTSLLRQVSFRRSQDLSAFAEAMSKAQGAMANASKDSSNPDFHSTYASLASILDAIRKPFADNGLCYMQFPTNTEAGIQVETIVMHTSGQFVSCAMEMPIVKNDAQGLGMAITYCRRYTLAPICGISQADDDGNSASSPLRKLREATLKLLNQAKSLPDMEEAWKSLTVEARKACQADLPALKAKWAKEAVP